MNRAGKVITVFVFLFLLFSCASSDPAAGSTADAADSNPVNTETVQDDVKPAAEKVPETEKEMLPVKDEQSEKNEDIRVYAKIYNNSYTHPGEFSAIVNLIISEGDERLAVLENSEVSVNGRMLETEADEWSTDSARFVLKEPIALKPGDEIELRIEHEYFGEPVIVNAVTPKTPLISVGDEFEYPNKNRELLVYFNDNMPINDLYIGGYFDNGGSFSIDPRVDANPYKLKTVNEDGSVPEKIEIYAKQEFFYYFSGYGFAPGSGLRVFSVGNSVRNY